MPSAWKKPPTTRAEDFGRRAVATNPRDPWAIHAVAHVMEMQGRQANGIAWLTGSAQDWSRDNFFAYHNWWHLALYHLDLEQHERVLQLYDAVIRRPAAVPGTRTCAGRGRGEMAGAHQPAVAAPGRRLNLNRNTPQMLKSAGFRIETIEGGYMPDTPRFMGFRVHGVAMAG
jgi:hypothetical protein